MPSEINTSDSITHPTPQQRTQTRSRHPSPTGKMPAVFTLNQDAERIKQEAPSWAARLDFCCAASPAQQYGL